MRITEKPTAYDPNADINRFVIGAASNHYGSGGDSLVMDIANIKIWFRALDEAEVNYYHVQ